MGARRTELGDALSACLREDANAQAKQDLTEIVARGRTDALVRLARYHRVVPFLYLQLRNVPAADPTVMSELEREYALRAAQHMRALADLAALKEILDQRGIDWLVVKGPILAEILYPRPDLRMYGDLDIVVAREAYARAIEALEGEQSELLDRNWELIRREQRGQLHFVLSFGTVADLHWHLLNRESVRRSLSLSMDGMFDRAVEVDLPGLRVRTLDRVDTLAHLCVHAALSGADRLGWLKDIEQATVARSVPWDQVIERAAAWRAGPLVAVALERSQRSLGTPVPREVVTELFGSRVRHRLSHALDSTWPPEISEGRSTPALLWAQTLRSSWRATLATILRRALRSVTRVVTGAPPGRDEDSPIMVPGGDEQAREDFLRGVGEGADPGSGDPA